MSMYDACMKRNEMVYHALAYSDQPASGADGSFDIPPA